MQLDISIFLVTSIAKWPYAFLHKIYNVLNVTYMTFNIQHCVIIFLAFKIFQKKKGDA